MVSWGKRLSIHVSCNFFPESSCCSLCVVYVKEPVTFRSPLFERVGLNHNGAAGGDPSYAELRECQTFMEVMLWYVYVPHVYRSTSSWLPLLWGGFSIYWRGEVRKDTAWNDCYGSLLCYVMWCIIWWYILPLPLLQAQQRRIQELERINVDLERRLEQQARERMKVRLTDYILIWWWWWWWWCMAT